MEIPQNIQSHNAVIDNVFEQPLLHDAEVLANAIDTFPHDSPIMTYLGMPAYKLDGDSRLQDTGYSNYQIFKQELNDATEAMHEGKIGRARLMSGMVNAYYDAHNGTNTPNLRSVFEALYHLHISGSSSFHAMFNQEGETVGILGMGLHDTSKANAMVLAQGAAKLLQGRAVVMFTDYKGKPGSKMYSFTDPTTGEQLPNTFLRVFSGTFDDKEGSTSHNSNLASAEVILIPDALITHASKPQTAEVAESKESLDINTVD